MPYYLKNNGEDDRSELRRPRSIARMTWKEKKTERICRGCTRLPVHDGRGPSWALQRDEAAFRAPTGRYTQGGPAGGQSLRRDDVAGSRTDDEFGQGHLRNQQPRHSYARD